MAKELKDSGKREDFESGCVRDTAENKSRPDLISPYFNMRVGDHLDKGARKYAERNWEKGMPISRCIASLERHLNQYKQGLTDEDHLAAIGCNTMFTIHYEELIKRGILPAELNDMPFYESGGKIHEEIEELTGHCFANHYVGRTDVMCHCEKCVAEREDDVLSQVRESADRIAENDKPRRDSNNSGGPRFA